MERKRRVVPREVSPADGNKRTNSPRMKSVSNNEWREVSRGHSTIMVASIVGRTEL